MLILRIMIMYRYDSMCHEKLKISNFVPSTIGL